MKNEIRDTILSIFITAGILILFKTYIENPTVLTVLSYWVGAAHVFWLYENHK